MEAANCFLAFAWLAIGSSAAALYLYCRILWALSNPAFSRKEKAALCIGETVVVAIIIFTIFHVVRMP